MSETTNNSTGNNSASNENSDTSLNNGRLYQRRIRTFEQPQERRPQNGTENRSNNSSEFNTGSPFIDSRPNPFIDSRPNPFLSRKENPFISRKQNPFLPRQPHPEPEEPPIRRLPSREELQERIKQGAIEFRAEYEQKYGKNAKAQIQAKPLTVSEPDDPLEKEVDRMADTVLRMEALPEEEKLQREAMPEGEELRRAAVPEEEELQRETMPEEDEEKVARKPAQSVNTPETALYRALAELSKTPEQNATTQPGPNGKVPGKVVSDRQQNLIKLPTGTDGIQRVLSRDARGIKIVERHPAGLDGVARQKVYRMTVAEAARAGALGSEEPLQRANDGALTTSGDTAARIESKRGRGETLGTNEREFFETRMDADFSNVRIHRDAEAASLAKDVNAKAFTIGGDVFFGEGQYQPGSSAGKRLIAHELTHTLQQGAADRVAREAEGASKHGGPAGESNVGHDYAGGVKWHEEPEINEIISRIVAEELKAGSEVTDILDRIRETEHREYPDGIRVKQGTYNKIILAHFLYHNLMPGVTENFSHAKFEGDKILLYDSNGREIWRIWDQGMNEANPEDLAGFFGIIKAFGKKTGGVVLLGIFAWLRNKAMRAVGKETAKQTEKEVAKNLLIPQGVDPTKFREISALIRSQIKSLGEDVAVHGSRASYSAHLGSDLDIAIRVPENKFLEIIQRSFGSPNPGSSKERTLMRALETGKIQAGEVKLLEGGTLSTLRKKVESLLGIGVDISVIRIGGTFDRGPYIPLP